MINDETYWPYLRQLDKKKGQKYLIEKKKWIVNLIDNSIYSNCFLFSPS